VTPICDTDLPISLGNGFSLAAKDFYLSQMNDDLLCGEHFFAY